MIIPYGTIVNMFTQTCYHVLLLLIDMLLLWSIRRSAYTSFLSFFVLAGLGIFANVLLAVALSGLIDSRVSASFVLPGFAWHGTFFLAASALLMYWQKQTNGKPRRWLPSLMLVFACIYAGVALDALFIGPTALVIRETTITTDKITKPITLVFCSDIQTDRVGNYERRTLQTIKKQHADLILFGGDYVQGETIEEQQQLLSDLNQLFREMNLQAPLGIYAVQGNVGSMQGLFENTAIVSQESTVTEQIGDIRITFLSLEDSGISHPISDEKRENKFRIMVGHIPRYAMAEQEADLMLAGHTHGGQVQIPFLGPLVTAAGRDFPRKWVSGITVMSNGAILIVSNGSGHEHGRAPRVRFFCRPDIWVIRIIPNAAKPEM